MGPKQIQKKTRGGDQHLDQQETPHWHTPHVPKAASIAKNPSINPVREQGNEREEKGIDTRNSEKITAKLKEIIRYQKRT